MAAPHPSNFDVATAMPAGADLPSAQSACSGTDASPLELRRLDDFGAAADFVARLGPDCLCLPYNSLTWTEAYATTLGSASGHEPVLAGLWLGGIPVAFIPFECVSRGRLKILRFLGQDRINQSTGVWRRGMAGMVAPHDMQVQLRRLGKEVGADLAELANMPAVIDGTPNPIAVGFGVSSPSPVFQGTLSDDFDSLFRSAYKRESRRKLQKKTKALIAAGDYQIVLAATDDQIDHGLDTFIQQRQIRAADTGIPNVFVGSDNRAFLKKLLTPAQAGAPATLQIWWLECAGKIRATSLTSKYGHTLYGYGNSIAHDELTTFSPGIVLYNAIIADACADPALTHIDLGLGDERYKRSWSKPVALSDHLMPLTLPGHLATRLHLAKQALKGKIRSSERLWQLVRWIRRTKARSGKCT
ncbi:GNAT family N-acetyltransferase [Roseibium sp.]|uniref:GNAT family N-acetyltransferase n=1 Tax=Roseibium sp. TaxID=1936156 RepID=UPI003A981C58